MLRTAVEGRVCAFSDAFVRMTDGDASGRVLGDAPHACIFSAGASLAQDLLRDLPSTAGHQDLQTPEDDEIEACHAS